MSALAAKTALSKAEPTLLELAMTNDDKSDTAINPSRWFRYALAQSMICSTFSIATFYACQKTT
jgi:hypothetical protein